MNDIFLCQAGKLLKTCHLLFENNERTNINDILTTLCGVNLRGVSSCRDLGVAITDDLLPSVHIHDIVVETHQPTLQRHTPLLPVWKRTPLDQYFLRLCLSSVHLKSLTLLYGHLTQNRI